MTKTSRVAAVQNRPRARWAADVLLVVGECIVLFVTATTTAVAIPPATAPPGEYDHVVNTYSWVVMATVLSVLAWYLVRRRWIAAFLQVLLVLAGIVSIIVLHRVRITGGLTGY